MRQHLPLWSSYLVLESSLLNLVVAGEGDDRKALGEDEQKKIDLRPVVSSAIKGSVPVSILILVIIPALVMNKTAFTLRSLRYCCLDSNPFAKFERLWCLSMAFCCMSQREGSFSCQPQWQAAIGYDLGRWESCAYCNALA